MNKSGQKSGSSAKSAMARVAHLMDPNAELEAMDAIEVLKAQHREVEQLFKAFKKAEDDEDQALELAQQICMKLTVHAAIEEEIFYPAAREANNAEDIVLEALEEHLSVKRIIADVEKLNAGDETLQAKISVLEEQVKHHVKEEETELFPKVKKAMAKGQREELGSELLRRARDLDESHSNGRARSASRRSSRA